MKSLFSNGKLVFSVPVLVHDIQFNQITSVLVSRSNTVQFTLNKTAVAVCLALSSPFIYANGLAINEQSASGAGTAYAGRASSALDASTIYGNPAGLSRLQQSEVILGAAAVKAKVDISNVSTSKKGTHKGDMVPFATVPFAYYATPVNEHWAVGVGMYVPFALISDYEKAFQGSDHGLYSKVAVMTIQPTVSYKFNDHIAVGFGPTINRLDGKLTSTVNTSVMPGQADTKVNIKGDDTAYGFNLGILVDFNERTAWGITYHSKVDYEITGHTSVAGAPAVPVLGNLNGKYSAKLDLTTPESIDTSITHQLNDQWTIHAGATYTRWSRLESIVAKNKGMPATTPEQFRNMGESFKWHNTWAYSIGASYQARPDLVLRAGFALDASPTTNEHRTVRVPVGNRKILALGAGWTPQPNMTFDIAYAYIRESKTSVSQTEGQPLKAPFSATYRNSAHGLVGQMVYRF